MVLVAIFEEEKTHDINRRLEMKRQLKGIKDKYKSYCIVRDIIKETKKTMVT